MTTQWFYLPQLATIQAGKNNTVYLSDTPGTQTNNTRFQCSVSNLAETSQSFANAEMVITMPTVTITNSLNVSQSALSITLRNVYNAPTDKSFVLTYDKPNFTVAAQDLAALSFGVEYAALDSSGSITTQTSLFTYNGSGFLQPVTTASDLQLGNWYRFAYIQGDIAAKSVMQIVEPVPGSSATVQLVQNSGGETPVPLTFVVPLVRPVPGFDTTCTIPNVQPLTQTANAGAAYVRVLDDPSSPLLFGVGVGIGTSALFTLPSPPTAPGRYALTGPSDKTQKYVFFTVPSTSIVLPNGYTVGLQTTVEDVTPPAVLTLISNLNAYFAVCVTATDPATNSPTTICVPGSVAKSGQSKTTHLRDKSTLVFSSQYQVAGGTFAPLASSSPITFSATAAATKTVVATVTLGTNLQAQIINTGVGEYTVDAQIPVGTMAPANAPALPQSKTSDVTSYMYFQNALAVPIQYAIRSTVANTPLSFAPLAPNGIVLLPNTATSQSIVTRTADDAFGVELAIGKADSAQSGILTLSNTKMLINGVVFYQLNADVPFGYVMRSSQTNITAQTVGLVLVNMGTQTVTVSVDATPIQLEGQEVPVLSQDVILTNAKTVSASTTSTLKLGGTGTPTQPLSLLLSDPQTWNTDDFYGTVDTTTNSTRPVVTVYVRDKAYYVAAVLASDDTRSDCPDNEIVTLDTTTNKLFGSQETLTPAQYTAIVKFSSLTADSMGVAYGTRPVTTYPLGKLYTDKWTDGQVTVTSATPSTLQSPLPSVARVTFTCTWSVSFVLDVTACSECTPEAYAASVIVSNATTLVRGAAPSSVLFKSRADAITICTNNNSQMAWSGTVNDLMEIGTSEPAFPPNTSATDNLSYIAVTSKNPMQVTIYCSCGTFGKMCGTYVPPSNNNDNAAGPQPAADGPTPATSGPSAASSPSVTPQPSSSSNVPVVIGIIAGVVVLLAVLIGVLVYVVKKRRRGA